MQNAHGFLTVDEVARDLRCTPKTVRKMISQKLLAADKVARKWLIPATEIQRLRQDALTRLYLEKFGGTDHGSEQHVMPFDGLRQRDARNPDLSRTGPS